MFARWICGTGLLPGVSPLGATNGEAARACGSDIAQKGDATGTMQPLRPRGG